MRLSLCLILILAVIRAAAAEDAPLLSGSLTLSERPAPRPLAGLDKPALIGALKLSLNFMRSQDRERRALILREFRSRFSEFPTEAAKLLRDEHQRQVDALKAYISRAPDFAEIRRHSLFVARRHALTLIFDTPSYHGGSGGPERQSVVDAAVNAVAQLYYNPLPEFLRQNPEAMNCRDNVTELQATLSDLRLLDPAKEFDEKAFRQAFTDAYTDALRSPLDRRIKQDAEAVKDILGPEAWTIINAVGEYRDMMGMGRLVVDLRLTTAAEKHSREMHDLVYFSHDSPTAAAATVAIRARAEHFDFSQANECIYHGAHQPSDAFLGWFNSPENHRNMLDQRVTHLGAGRAREQDGQEIWTLVLARPADQRELPSLSSGTAVDASHPRVEYRRRAMALKPADADGHWALAQWCHENGLFTQESVEAMDVLEISPDHEAARAALGFIKSGASWIKPGPERLPDAR
jgi:uncharacterized protein YkwD